tara:strand:- start:21 stop:413 length:393 start_codon:yes stop_codon:yes gene_type:complete
MKTSFFVSLSAAEWGDTYAEEAGKMANVFVDIFSDAAKIAVLTKNVELSMCHSEVDVGLDDPESPEAKLVGRAVIEFEAENRVTFDKTRLSQMLRSAAPWKNCKVEKRAVDTSILEEASHAVTEDAAVVA